MHNRSRGFIHHKARVYAGGDKDCLVCGGREMKPIGPSLPVPLNPGLLWSRKEDSLSVPLGDIQLGFCPLCGHTQNYCYNSDLLNYNEWYQHSLHDQSIYRGYHRLEVDRLVDRYGVKGKEVFEICTNSGEFSRLLCELADNQAVIQDANIFIDAGSSGQIMKLTYILSHISQEPTKILADLICCCGVLAELSEPRKFLNSIHDAISDSGKTLLNLEVLNAGEFFTRMKLWDIKYSQCSLFSSHSLKVLLENCGFETLLVREINDGKILSVDSRVKTNDSPLSIKIFDEELDRIKNQVATFEIQQQEEIEHWQDFFNCLLKEEKTAVLWGCDERGVAAINMLHLQEKLSMVVDSNLERIELFLPGTPLRVHSPTELQRVKPDVILVSNPIHENKIRIIAAGLGLSSDFVLL